jgi:hypothetical protein
MKREYDFKGATRGRFIIPPGAKVTYDISGLSKAQVAALRVRSHLTKAQERELRSYVAEYKYGRRIHGTWWELATAIEIALAEIRRHRSRRRSR